MNTLLVVFIALATAAIVLQAFAMYGIFRVMEQLRREIQGMRAEMKERLDPLTASVTALVNDSHESIRTLTANAAEITRMVREQGVRVNGLVGDAVERSRRQLVRLDETATSIIEKVNNISSMVERTILTPLEEVGALIKGIRAGVDFFTKRRSANVSDVRQDEEMFI